MSSDKETTWPLTAHRNDGMVKYGTKGAYRDMLGYGPSSVSIKWPKGAKVALNFVINYEEGGEQCILHGDDGTCLCVVVLYRKFLPPRSVIRW